VREDLVSRLREICLELPEAEEKIAWSTPTFRVGGKIFAQYEEYLHGDTRIGVWCKAPDGMQEALVSTEPDAFYIPPYVGHKGWVAARLDLDPDWDQVRMVIEESYRLTAPKRALKALEARIADAMAG
jgi:predicted DNA-binding protein (MmcQ/YjbR family)